tara:strand:+ start:419 stop:790 length:372 start_codon:yes stop_codon:yes gene_type:complete
VFFLVGGYFGFNNGVKLNTEKVNDCLSLVDLGKDENFLYSDHKVLDDFIEVSVINISECFIYEDLKIIYNIFSSGESRELSFKLNNKLRPTESGLIKIEIIKIEPFDSIQFKSFFYKNFKIYN